MLRYTVIHSLVCYNVIVLLWFDGCGYCLLVMMRYTGCVYCLLVMMRYTAPDVDAPVVTLCFMSHTAPNKLHADLAITGGI